MNKAPHNSWSATLIEVKCSTTIKYNTKNIGYFKEKGIWVYQFFDWFVDRISDHNFRVSNIYILLQGFLSFGWEVDIAKKKKKREDFITFNANL